MEWPETIGSIAMKLLLPAPLPSSLPEALSPLEEGLRGPDAEQAREQTLAQLGNLAQRTRAGISEGVMPERYRDLAVLLDACQAAQEVVENWPAAKLGHTLPPSFNGSGFSLPNL